MKRWAVIALLLTSPWTVLADPTPASWDESRLKGFHRHQGDNAIIDREREKGKNAYLEEYEAWERIRRNSIADYKKQIKMSSPQENGPEHKKNLQERIDTKIADEKLRVEYVRMKQAMSKRQQTKVAVTPEEELGLENNRPRYDVRKRVLYGARSKIKSGGPSFGGGGGVWSGGGGSSGSSGGGGNFPPPPTFDDFPQGGGQGDAYIPPPIMPDYNEDMPPPPPPAPAFEDGGDYPAPPPPPDFGDFPPPPPLMPEN